MQLKNDTFEKQSDLDSKLYIKPSVQNETHKDSSIPDSDHHHEPSTDSNEILNSLTSPVQNETRKDSIITDFNHHQESSTDIKETLNSLSSLTQNETRKDPSIPDSNQSQEPSTDSNKTLNSIDDPYWLDIKVVQFNQTQEEIEKLDEIKRLDTDAKDNVTLPFHRHDGGVIVTKVLWPKDLDLLKRMLCLQKAAYNRVVNYDIVVFTTLPWTMEEVEDLGRVVAPAKLIVSNEGPTLEEHLAGMTDDEIKFLEKRCHVNHTEKNLTWHHHCQDDRHTNSLAYSWQAEFRAYHIWTHPALRNYKYMIWLDADSLCSRTWYNDPIDAMVKQNLTLIFAAFKGTIKSKIFRNKTLSTYGEELCWNGFAYGHMNPTKSCTRKAMRFRAVAGNFHITNLNIYRKERHQNFLKVLVGDYKFSRQWDDQLAVTVVGAMEDPKRAWHLRSHNFRFNINHHRVYDGQEKIGFKSIHRWWTIAIRNKWHAGRLLCDHCFQRVTR